MRRASALRVQVAVGITSLLLTTSTSAAVAQEAPPATLTGEVLSAATVSTCVGLSGVFPQVCIAPDTPAVSQVDVDAQCNTDGTGTITYRASGVATGPYPGTFMEVGTVKVGAPDPLLPNNIVNRQVDDFHAQFVIDSAVGQISGRKFLAEQRSFVGRRSALCTREDIAGLPFEAILTDAIRYEATIDTPAGRFADAGRTGVRVIGLDTYGLFVESYISDYITPVPLTTPGHVTGGGTIEHLDGRAVTFGFTSRVESTGKPQAHCSVVDQVADVHVRCLSITTMVQGPTRATFRGLATIDGEPTEYRIDVDDLDESGIGRDTFKINTDTGYTVGGVLTSGNVQLHEAS